MAAENAPTATLGWLHPGYCFTFPHVIHSTEHRRRLQHVQDVANGLIRSSLAAACLAQDFSKPTVVDHEPVDTRGWKRIVVGETGANASSRLRAVRLAVGEVSLTQEAYKLVQQEESEGNEDTRILLSVAAESGFRSPSDLLYAVPALGLESAGTAPPVRLRPRSVVTDLDEVYGLLPDIDIAIREVVTGIAANAGIRTQE